MATKRKTREQIRAKRERQKRNEIRKAAFLRSLIMKKFDDMKPVINKVRPEFAEDTFEYILANERFLNQQHHEFRRNLIHKKF